MTIKDMAQALAARDAGISSSAEHAESDAPGWSQRAYQAIVNNRSLKFYESFGFSMESARESSYEAGLDRPVEERAWGAVTQRLLRDGIIEPVGYAKVASSHGSPKRTYRLRRAI